MQATRHAATMPNTFVAERAAQQEREPRKSEEIDELALPGGTLLEGLRIVRPIGKGGFGIVYLAWDSQLERHVAIKEYMPSALVRRAQPSLDVEMRSEEDREVFEAGRRSFVNEARLLARFDHPSLVKVFRFWEAHRTAYMAMPYYQGPTLKTALCSLPGPATEEQLRGWLDPIMDALAVLHREKCYHRDVSPDNILLTATGPLLLDFGAARRVISDRTQALTAVLKPGFAPIEQYGGTQLQGPWTDLYALAGVMHYAITGRPPVAAAARVVQDTRQALAETHAGRWRHGFLLAIDAALALRPEDRPQDVAQFRALLDVGQARDSAPLELPVVDQREIDTAPGLLEATVALGEPTRADCWDSTVAVLPQGLAPPSRRRGRRGRVGSLVALAGCLVLVSGASWWWTHAENPSEAPDTVPSAAVLAPATPTEARPAIVAPAPVVPSTASSAPAAQVTTGDLVPSSGPSSKVGVADETSAAGEAHRTGLKVAPSLGSASAPAPALASAAERSADAPAQPMASVPPSAPVAALESVKPPLSTPPPPARPAESAPAVARTAPAPRAPLARATNGRAQATTTESTQEASRRTTAAAVAQEAVPVAEAHPARHAARAAAASEPHPARCSELILKSSLDTLRPDEVAYLKKECR